MRHRSGGAEPRPGGPEASGEFAGCRSGGRDGGPACQDSPTRTYPFVVHSVTAEPFDLDLLDEEEPFEIDDQAAHLFKHSVLGIEDIHDVWRSDPLFYPAKLPAHWLMVSEVAGHVLVVPLAPPESNEPTRCRPIGCYGAATHLAARYRKDR